MINSFDKLFLIDNSIISEKLLQFLSLLADPKANLLFWAFISLFFLWRKGISAFKSNPLHLFLLTNCIMLICGVIKIAAGRARPYLLAEQISGFHYFSVDNGYLSFPSSHAAIALAFSIFLKRKYGFHSAIYLFPLLIGSARILLNVHFASDVIAGFVIGFFAEIIVNQTLLKIKKLRGPKTS